MIRMENLSKSFGAVQAVKDVSLHVPRGELFCFLGPNGAGKTTTLKLLAGLLRPTAGSIHIGGIDLQAEPVKAKRLIGYIPDMPFLYESLTASEFLEFMGGLYNVPKNPLAGRKDHLLDLFGLNDSRDSLIRDFSHGMRQRLIYAAAFIHEPEVLLVDEPLIGLDPYSIRLIKDLLVSKARAGMTIFLTTHILALAEEIGGRIGIILNGRIVALGPLRELVRQSGVEGTLENVFLALTSGRPGKEGAA